MSNLIEDWDHVWFSLVFWLTSMWPWDQPWGKFLPLIGLLTCLLCWSCGTPTSVFARKPSSVYYSQWGFFYMLCSQTFKHHFSFTSLYLSPPTLCMPDNQLWAAFLENPWQCLLQQPLAFVVKPPMSKRTLGTGAINCKVNAEKKWMQVYSCGYRSSACLQVLHGFGWGWEWWKSAC